MDIVLLGPQIRFKFKQINALCEHKGIPVVVIDNIDYGMMNGEKILDEALNLIR
ncbi:Lichenan-specific phosphotransferase enzyme IIB component [compost metagenome]